MCVEEQVFDCEPTEETVEQPKKKDKWKSVTCPVVGFDARYGIVAFTLDGTFCQGVVPVGTPVGKTVAVKYTKPANKNLQWKIDV